MQLVKKIIGPVLFLLFVLVVVEQSYRYYILGPMAFNLLKVNSMNTLMRSEYVQLAEFPDIFFELKPDMRGWYKGVEFWTNSAGLADVEYSRVKPAETFRIAVAGSSWEMPSGVPPDTAWHAVLENQLNENTSGSQIEVINFGVEMYGLREIVGTVRHKITGWDPDLILVGVTTYTTSLIWNPADQPQSLPPRDYPALVPFSLGAVGYLLDGKWGIASEFDRQSLDDGQITERMAQLQRALDELGAISKQANVPIVVVFVDFFPFPPQVEADVRQMTARAGVQAVFASQVFPADFEMRKPYVVSPFDPHPSEAGHVLIAEYVAARLADLGLLPRR